jgi:photosystem II stability/assembly factor-like uncharacterized protein
MRTILIIFIFLFGISVCNSDLTEYFEIDYVNTDYNDIEIANDSTIFICGSNGIIHYSNDKGNTWTKCKTNSYKYLLAIDSYEDFIVSVGYDGIILYSNNRGKSWNKSNSDLITSFFDVVLIDNNTGFIFGDAGTILKTTDSGLNWSTVISPSLNRIKAAISIGNKLLFATDFGSIFISSDSGDSWNEIKPDNKSFVPYNFDKDNNNLNLYTNIGIYKSVNQGIDWEFIELNLSNYKSGCAFNVNQMIFVGNQMRYLATENINSISEDSSFETEQYPYGGIYINKICKLNNNELISVGSNNLIIKRDLKNLQWNFISYLNGYRDHGFGGLSFLGDSTVYIGGYLEQFYRSTDAGTTWVNFNDFKNGVIQNTIQNIDFADFNNGSFISSNSLGSNYIIRTTDAGMNYKRGKANQYLSVPGLSRLKINESKFLFSGSQIYNNNFYFIYNMCENDTNWYNSGYLDSLYVLSRETHNNNIFLAGAWLDSSLFPLKPYSYFRGIICKSTDEGLSWEKAYINNVSALKSKLYLPNYTVLIIGSVWTSINVCEKSYIYKSYDNEANWTIIDSTLSPNISYLALMNDKYILGLAENNKFIFSTDFGESWSISMPFPEMQLLGLKTSKNYAYLLTRIGEFNPFVIRLRLKDEFVDVKESVTQFETPLAWIFPPYPNPANNCVNFDIAWARKFSNEDIEVNIYTLFGKKVENPSFEIINRTVNSGFIRWYSTGLLAGIYFVELNVGGYKRVQKVILY